MSNPQFMRFDRTKLEREREQSLDRVREYTRLAEEAQSAVNEIAQFLALAEKWAEPDSLVTGVELPQERADHLRTAIEVTEGGEYVRQEDSTRVKIRPLVRQFLRDNLMFTSNELIQDIISRFPTAKANSIQGELSRAKSRQDVLPTGDRGMYRSLIYGKNPDEESTDTEIDGSEEEEVADSIESINPLVMQDEEPTVEEFTPSDLEGL